MFRTVLAIFCFALLVVCLATACISGLGIIASTKPGAEHMGQSVAYFGGSVSLGIIALLGFQFSSPFLKFSHPKIWAGIISFALASGIGFCLFVVQSAQLISTGRVVLGILMLICIGFGLFCFFERRPHTASRP